MTFAHHTSQLRHMGYSVCVSPSDNKEESFAFLPFLPPLLLHFKIKESFFLLMCSGVQHGCGTALNEATTVMGYQG